LSKDICEEPVLALELKIEGNHGLLGFIAPSSKVHFLHMTKIVAQAVKSLSLLLEPSDHLLYPS
jgi:hypothetical protein